jgi:phosphatidylserine/phosphatidylglycerophosphate/cardiolipin synthase-like enzyme
MRHSARKYWACLLIAASNVHAFDALQAPLPAQGSLQAAFAPWDNVEALIIETIQSAKKQILVQAFLLTSKKIAAALILAHQRGLDVRILVDARLSIEDVSSKVSMLADAGIPVWLETKYQNAHNKTIVIDATTPDAVIITGSYNFTWSAQHKNAENILIVRQNVALASRYATNWERHKQDATPYKKCIPTCFPAF